MSDAPVASEPAAHRCTLERVVDEDGDAVVDYTCTEVWRRDGQRLVRRDCEAADGHVWGEDNEWDPFGCPIRTEVWGSGPHTVLTYDCDARHQVVRTIDAWGDVTQAFVNAYDGFGRIVKHTIPGPDPEYSGYTDKKWWWQWGADGRLLAEGYSQYGPGSYSTTYEHDGFGTRISSEYFKSNGHYPPLHIVTTYDSLGRPVAAHKTEWSDSNDIVWTYDDDAATVLIRETNADGVLVAQERQTEICP